MKYGILVVCLLMGVWACTEPQTDNNNTTNNTDSTKTENNNSTDNNTNNETSSLGTLDGFWSAFQTSVVAGDKDKVVALFTFPLEGDFPNSKEELVQSFDSIFDQETKDIVKGKDKSALQGSDADGYWFNIVYPAPEEGMDGASTSFKIKKVGEEYKIVGLMMAG